MRSSGRRFTWRGSCRFGLPPDRLNWHCAISQNANCGRLTSSRKHLALTLSFVRQPKNSTALPTERGVERNSQRERALCSSSF